MACVQIMQAPREKSSEMKDNQRQCVCGQADAQMENTNLGQKSNVSAL